MMAILRTLSMEGRRSRAEEPRNLRETTAESNLSVRNMPEIDLQSPEHAGQVEDPRVHSHRKWRRSHHCRVRMWDRPGCTIPNVFSRDVVRRRPLATPIDWVT